MTETPVFEPLTLAKAAEIIYCHVILVDCRDCGDGILGIGTSDDVRQDTTRDGWVYPNSFDVERTIHGASRVIGLCPSCSIADAETNL